MILLRPASSGDPAGGLIDRDQFVRPGEQMAANFQGLFHIRGTKDCRGELPFQERPEALFQTARLQQHLIAWTKTHGAKPLLQKKYKARGARINAKRFAL